MPLCLINYIRLSFIRTPTPCCGVDERKYRFTSGVLTSLAAAVQTFTKPGDSILIHDPVYPPFSSIIETNQRHIVRSSLLEK